MNSFLSFLLLQAAWILGDRSWSIKAFSPSSPLRLPVRVIDQKVATTTFTLSTALYQSESPSEESNKKSKPNDIFSSIQDVQFKIDTESYAKSFSQSFSALQTNIQDGEFGSRGEIYFALQLFLVLCILFGTVPFVGDIVSFIFGPFLILLGGSTASLGVAELGSNLTPWPSPPKDGSLVTDSLVYNEVRHPMYAGLLYLMFGLSMWSGSAMRVLLCIALWYLLDYKSELEETKLIEKFGTEYILYKEKVKGKFIPRTLTDSIENLALTITENDDDLDI